MDCELSSAGAALIGAFVGSLSSLGAVWLSHWLASKSEKKLDKLRRDRLKVLLSGEKYVWRHIGTLASSIGADHFKTASLLIEIEARASNTGSGSWALVSRAPFPKDLVPDPE